MRGGEVVGRVKNTMVAGNVYELLSGAVELSSDRDEERRLPHLLVEGLSASGAEEP
ncbi:MAG: metallopeptidase TldD-related protein [Planctomycetota bacterium]